MTTVTSNPNSARRPDWQPGHVPRLSYRNPLPPGESLPQRETAVGSPTVGKPGRPGLSIREIREALPRDVPVSHAQPQSGLSPSQAQKPKKSFLGGLFSKEPTLVALDQVAQQMLAQHGSITPKTIPHVSSQKMPEHVPKVNSKWDGVPEYVKMREKQDKDKGRNGRRESVRPIYTGSNSTDLADDSSAIRRRNSNAASTTESWDSRSSGSRPVFQDNNSMRPESLYSSSSETSIYAIQRSSSGLTPTFNTFGIPKSPKASICWAGETPTPPTRLQRNQSSQSTSTVSTSSTDQNRPDRYGLPIAPSADIVPGYTSSTATTPLERSPQTPAPLFDEENSLATSLRQVPALPASATMTKQAAQSETGLIRNSDSTNPRKKTVRPGLGLQINPVAPWDSQVLPSEASKSPHVDSPSRTRPKGRVTGKERK